MKLKKKFRLVIASDGAAGSGKTTGSKLISHKYGLKFLDSGILYRYVAYKLLEKKNSSKDYLKKITKKIQLNKLKMKQLYNPKVTKYTALIAKSKKVRDLLKKFQKNFSKQRLVCICGRDIGSVICKDADIKFFFKCSLNVRAKRRWKEYRINNKKINLTEVKKALKQRDFHDIHRKESPLKRTKDSILIDTSKINKKQMLDKLSGVIEKKLKIKYGSIK